MRAAAPSALSDGLAKSSGFAWSGPGQQGLMRPPVANVIGFTIMPRNCATPLSHQCFLQAAFCSGVSRILLQMLPDDEGLPAAPAAVGAEGTAGTVGTAGAVGTLGMPWPIAASVLASRATRRAGQMRF